MEKHLETIRNIAFYMEGLAVAFRMTGNQMLADKMENYASLLLNAKSEIELEMDAATKNMAAKALIGAAFRSKMS